MYVDFLTISLLVFHLSWPLTSVVVYYKALNAQYY